MKAISRLMAWALPTLACMLCLGMGETAVGQTPDAVQPVYTNKTRFRIPFRYDAAEMQRIGAKEIRLYLSSDRGQTWQLSRQANPQAGKFDFQAPASGEYWFAVRTLDGRNQLYPPTKVLTAGLKVVVDNTPPTLAIQLGQAQPGKVKMNWQSNDPNLDVSTLRLEYIQAGSEKWEMVSVIPQANGQTAWSVPQGGFVAVRGQIFDLAGNVQQTQSQVRLQPAAAVPNLNDPIATPGLNNSIVGQPSPSLPPVVPNPFQGNPGTLPGNMAPPAVVPADPEFNPTPQDNLISNSPERTPDVMTNPYAPKQAPQVTESRPPKITKHTRVVNSRKFQIGYKVEDVGPSGVGDVELFITEDDGANWYKYGNDADRKSPFQVETPRDGIFGFDLRVHSGAGLAADPPKPGDKPSIVVVVDNTPPKVQLLSADQGRGKDLNRVVIRWSVSDEFPSDSPVALSYTNDPNGVWEPISGWINNDGEYTWNAGP
ncbi:MAG: hypothetical protein KDA84_11165, partial [Planctomycetaceae bacterium]|nr:hypothetical protein [Planctomycetaceae bacterium]